MEKPSRKGKTSLVGNRPGRPSGISKPPGGRNRGEAEEEDSGQAGNQEPQEKAPPQPIKIAGISLGIKVSLATAVAVGIACAALVFAAFKGTAKEVDDEINDSGVNLVKILAGFDVPAWKSLSSNVGLLAFQQALNAYNHTVPPALSAIELDEATKKKLDEALNTVNEEMKKIQLDLSKQTFTGPFERLGNKAIASKIHLEHPAVLDILILNASKEGFLSLSGSSEIHFSPSPPPLQREDQDSPEITQGRYTGGGAGELARLFKYPIRNDEAVITGYVYLILSAKRIEQVQSRLLNAFLIPFLIAIGVGALVGYFMASSIVKPLKTLLRDIQIVSEGDLDHTTNPHSGDEIGLLAKAFNAMTKSLKIAHKAELETKALEHELNIATEIQSNLLPKRIPRFPGYDIGAFYRPSKEVGGDYYDFIQIDQENLGIVVADVSGKGIPGSMVMTMARSLLRMEAERNLSTADTLVKTNRVLARDIRRGMFVTSMYMILNVRNRTLLVSSAGHNPLIIARHATKNYELVNPNGIALGFDKGPIFERTIKEQRIQLFPGDRICAYTDGVVESMSPNNEEFGDEKFYEMNKALAAKTSNEFITTVVDALDKHQANGPQHDDITLVTVKLLPA